MLPTIGTFLQVVLEILLLGSLEDTSEILFYAIVFRHSIYLYHIKSEAEPKIE